MPAACLREKRSNGEGVPSGWWANVASFQAVWPSTWPIESVLVFWAFAASVLILILTITISNRGVVRVAGSIVLAILLAVGLSQRLLNRSGPDAESQRGKPSSPAAVSTAVPLDVVQVAEVQLSGNGAPFELRGAIRNSSADMRLRSVTLRIVRRDCFDGAIDPSGCIVVWEDQHWIQVNVPVNAERKFDDAFYAHTSVPRPRGTFKDEFRLIAASGHPDTP